MAKEWIEISAEIGTALKEAFANHLFELGAEGVDESSPSRVKGFFHGGDSAALVSAANTYLASLKELHTGEPVGKAEVKSVAKENWADSYKQFFVPQRLSDTFFLRPLWVPESTVPKELVPIHLDAGQAFGTGLHPTTQLTLRMMERWLKRNLDLSPLSALDVGTGSGILAIAAAKLGVGSVTAIDNDPIAVEVAAQNAKLNGCERIKISGADISTLSEPFDFIVSNILLETHILLLSDYLRLLKPSGVLIVSGLLGQQQTELNERFANSGLKLSSSAHMQEWMALRFIKQGD